MEAIEKPYLGELLKMEMYFVNSRLTTGFP